ncbi:hypothetical protein [Aliikangiella maris]|uniref:Uncharacterized protein n=2 Tax=Aliikangiella maris TaxID=3162458 RepID=A0ABV2BPW6_9GAMM
MNNEISAEFEVVLKRMKDKLDIKSDRALSRAMGMTDSGVATARSTKSLPIIPIVRTCIAQDLSLDEIFLGKDPSESSVQVAIVVSQVNDIVIRILDRVFTNHSLPPEQHFEAYKRLHQTLTKAAFENNFSESIVTTIAEAAVVMWK